MHVWKNKLMTQNIIKSTWSSIPHTIKLHKMQKTVKYKILKYLKCIQYISDCFF